MVRPKPKDAGACKLTPCGTPLRAGSVRSQAPAPLVLTSPEASRDLVPPAGELGGCSVPQGCAPAQPALLGPAGGPVAITGQARIGASGTAPSSLDKPDITRPGRPCIELTRRLWLGKVERETNAHRIGRAQQHTQRGEQLRAERLAEGQSWENAQSGLRWHHRRAEGHVHRFERVYECGEESFWIICQECGSSRERRRACRMGLLCLSCRGLVQQEKRRRFMRARQRAVESAEAIGLMIPGARKRWTEKFLTLPAPHCAEHSVSDRIEMIFAAWSLVLKSLNRWFLGKAGAAKRHVAWLRNFEWTPGRSDQMGHPHFHIWLLCPYIDDKVIRRFWRSALRTVGYSRESTGWCIVKIKKVWSPDGAARELIKYMTKDILPDRSHVTADVFARVYERLDGRRLMQSSAGFFAGLDQRPRCECGAVGCFRRSSTPPAVPALGEAANTQLPTTALTEGE
jgi:replication protein